MPNTVAISEQEYLTTSYRPDREFLNGIVQERNVGTREHGKLQQAIGRWFAIRRFARQMDSCLEQRIRVRAGRYRVPDVVIVRLPERDEQILTEPPYVCVEILSPEDTLRSIRPSVEDYLEMGVPNVWVMDPVKQLFWTATREGYQQVLDGILATTDGDLQIPIAELYTYY